MNLTDNTKAKWNKWKDPCRTTQMIEVEYRGCKYCIYFQWSHIGTLGTAAVIYLAFLLGYHSAFSLPERKLPIKQRMELLRDGINDNLQNLKTGKHLTIGSQLGEMICYAYTTLGFPPDIYVECIEKVANEQGPVVDAYITWADENLPDKTQDYDEKLLEDFAKIPCELWYRKVETNNSPSRT